MFRRGSSDTVINLAYRGCDSSRDFRASYVYIYIASIYIPISRYVNAGRCCPLAFRRVRSDNNEIRVIYFNRRNVSPVAVYFIIKVMH